MKFVVTAVFSLFFVNLVIAQEKAIKISNQNPYEEIIIKENKRIRVKTHGKKISGRFKIADNNSIILRKKRIELTEIEKIKRNPLAVAIVTGVVVATPVVLAAFAGFISLMLSARRADLPFLLVPAIGALSAIVIWSPNVLPGYKKEDNWKYEIIMLNEEK